MCLVQLAIPGEAEEDAVLVDPLSNGLELDPLYDLFRNEDVVKVFHAARQDIEIFCIEGDVIPTPLFDTQVAAMVAGFGEQVGYETLVRKTYALADVTHLRVIYEYLAAELDKSGRLPWVQEELAVLTDPATYVIDPQDAWKRVKTRTHSGKFLAIVRELARFREIYAQEKNVPRSRVMKDDALLELASTKPKSIKDLSRSRLLLRDARKGEIADGILAAVEAGLNTPPEHLPEPDRSRDKMQVNPALADLLRVLLKAKSEDLGVAQKLIATASDLDEIAAGLRDGAALRGWRKAAFGEDALKLCDGKLALRATGQRVEVFEI